MTEIADINYDFQETVRDKSVPISSTDKNLFKYISGSFCVANRTAINKIL